MKHNFYLFHFTDNTAEMRTITLSNGNINFIFVLMFLLTFVILLITEVTLTTYYKNHALHIQTYASSGETENVSRPTYC